MLINTLNMRGLDLKKEREKRGWTQGYFAELASVSKRTVINWEQSEEISASKVKLIQAILDNNNSKSENYSHKEINKQLQETEFEYEEAKKDFKVKGFTELVELGLKVVANYDELKELDIVKNLFELDILKERLKQSEQ